MPIRELIGFQDGIALTGQHMLAVVAILAGCMFHPWLARLSVATAGAYLIFGMAALDRGRGVYLYAWPVEKLLIWFGFAAPLWLLGLCVAKRAMASARLPPAIDGVGRLPAR